MADTPENPSAGPSGDDRLAEMVNDLAERLGRGEPVDIEAAIAGNPQYAQQLRELWPTVRKLAEFNLTASMAATFLASKAQSSPTARTPPPPTGNVIIAGRYRLLERLGEGGMGTVFAAEQTAPVRRKVALKLIKPGMDSHQVLARFEAERQALALMDHPNIAKVLDAALTDDGRPFFVMEYIKGVPIVEYCDAVRLTVRERLELFVPVCQAVQHAHQKGIIHRDLKPSNILVALYDDKPVPKVIDFGLAKAIHQPLIADPAYTAHEQVLGTPLYMSPEQANLNNLDIDTRTDVYALGVILYELLTGTTPLERKRIKKAAWEEMLRIIREEEPARPSTRLSSLDALASLAAQRQTDPAKLSRLVKGDLDWIVMKALEKDRNRRYDTATGFALDIQRHLADEPVIAGPPGVAYRARKFIQRNRKLVLATCGFFLLVIAGIIGTAWGLIRAERNDAETKIERAKVLIANADARTAQAETEKQQEIARLQADRARQFETFVNRLFRSADEFGFQGAGFRKEQEQSRELTVAGLIARAEGFVDAEFSKTPVTRADLLTVLGEVYRSQGKAQEAERLLNEALRLYREQPEPPDDRKVAQSLYVLASALADQGDYGRSDQLLREALGRLREDDPARTPLVTIVKNHLAWVLCEQGNFADAEPLFHDTIAAGKGKEKEAEWKQLLAMARIGHLSTLLALGKDQQAQQLLLAQLASQDPSLIVEGVLVYREIAADVEARRFSAALPKLRALLDKGKKRLGADHPAISMLLGVLADLQRKMGDFFGAEASIRESIEHVRPLFRDHPKLWEPMRELANYVASRGDFEEAEQLYRESLQIVTRRFGPDNPSRFYGPAFGLHESLGRLARDRGDYPAAETEFAIAIGLRDTVKEPNAGLWRQDADVQREMGHLERARGQLQISLEMFRAQNRVAEALDARDAQVELHRLTGDYVAANEVWQPLHDEYLSYRSFKQLRDYGSAAEAMAATVAQTRTRPDAEFLELPDQLLEQASLFVRAGQGAKAIPLLQESLTVYKHAFGPDYSLVRNVLLELAKAHELDGDSQVAETTAREACRVREERLGRSHLWTADALAELAPVLSRRGEHDEAISLLTETLNLRKSRLPATHSLVWKNELALAAARRRSGDHRAAAAGAREVLNSLAGLLPPASYRFAELHSALAESLAELGEFDEAERLLLTAYARQTEDVRDLCEGREATRMRLIQFYRAQNKLDEAAKYLEP